ncbi:glycosyltransferase 87 family protein [Oerskovia sp. NPDC057915]|uniref:glycosyltransferase 87 family protein n=1 Tax=Oerskovia sp. NPDC057915 TaxID=3346280 RepID=UPI0036DEAE67
MSPAPRAPRPDRRPSRALGWTVAAGVGALAFLVRWHLVGGTVGLRGYHGYDDGVYFSSAVAFVHGLLPYRDFLLLHPPGSMLALTPFAALTAWTSDSDALVAARAGFLLVGAANAVLVTRVARRWGTPAMVVGGVLYAVSFAAAWAERVTLLEPLGSLCLLGGVVLLLRGLDADRHPATGSRDGWLWAGGAVLGLGVTVKIWGVVPLAVVVVWLLVTAGWRVAVRAGAGAVGAVVVVVAPFALAAGTDMFRMVVLDQLGRPRETDTGVMPRLAWIAGSGNAEWVRTPTAEVALVVAVLSVVLVTAVAAWVGRRGRLWVALLVVQTVVLVASPSAYQQYAAFVVPALVLVVAAAISLVPARWREPVTALVCVGFTLGAGVTATPRTVPFPAAEVRSHLPDEGCVRADSPVLLALTDVMSRDLARGCELPVDLSGYAYDVGAKDAEGRPVPRDQNAAWQREALRYLTSGSATILARSVGNGFDAATVRTLDETTTTVLERREVRVLIPHGEP